MKVYEIISDVYPFEDKWAVDCRIMRVNNDDYESHRLTFTEQEDAEHFADIVTNLEENLTAHMEELAKEIYAIQSMMEEGEPYILLTSVEEENDEEEEATPRFLN